MQTQLQQLTWLQPVIFASSAADSAAASKELKYIELANRYKFVIIAVETHDPCNSKVASFLSELSRRITVAASDKQETSHLYQRLSVALQRFNAVCVADPFVREAEEDW